ncbi:MAG: transcriptional repressor [Anaerolineales bacterium]|jgi:Fe2+ or Zn2+ uptake regulation protein
MKASARDYRDLFHQQGFRVTPQRQLILDAVRKRKGHISPEEIFQQVHRKAPSIHRATVYRTLDFLCDLRLVVATRIQRHAYYEIAGKVAHHHLVCRRCNRVFPLDNCTVQRWFAQIKEQKHFQVDIDHLTLSGLCPACQAEDRRDLTLRRRP